MVESYSSPVFIPIRSLEGVSVVDDNLNHVVSLASLSDPVLSPAQLTNLEALLNFPGLNHTLQYYYDCNSVEGVPSSLFGPVVIQLQPADKVASLLYLERSIGDGFFHTIVLKEFFLKDGVPHFSDRNIDCIHFASKEQLRAHFNRVHPIHCVVSAMISLANAIFIINHDHDAGVSRFLEEKIRQMLDERNRQADSPSGLLLAEYGMTTDGRDFSIEPETGDHTLSGAWKQEFIELIMNFRVYASLLLDYSPKKITASVNRYVKESIGPLRVKYLGPNLAEGLFLYVRSHSAQGFEFWSGHIPLEGDKNNLQFNSEQIVVKKKRLSALDIIDLFPSIDSLDLLLPLFLQANRDIEQRRIPHKSIQEIIRDCRRHHPRETRQALQKLAAKHGCNMNFILDSCSEEEIRSALYRSIQLGRESRKTISEMRSYSRLGGMDDVLFPGSQEEFQQVQKERLRAVRDAEYRRRVQEINRKTPPVIRG